MNEQIHSLKLEVKQKQKEIDSQKQHLTELSEIMSRQVQDKSKTIKPPVEHRQGKLRFNSKA